jgi:hypothetical protein
LKSIFDMSRVRLTFVAIATALAVACGEGDAVQTPTGPSGTGSSQQPPQAGCSRPNAPANLAVASVAGTTVTLTWSAVNGATQYVVLVGRSPSSSDILSTNTTNTNYQWGGVPQGQHYARVQAMNSCGTSGSSNEINFTV